MPKLLAQYVTAGKALLVHFRLNISNINNTVMLSLKIVSGIGKKLTRPFNRNIFKRNSNKTIAKISEDALTSFIQGNAKDILLARCNMQTKSEFQTLIHTDVAKYGTVKAEAAVLVPICFVDGKFSLLFTLRSNELNSHRGEVSFPGGKRDISDVTIEGAAIRETYEELGINPSSIIIWARLPQFPNRQRTMDISPFVCYAGELDLSKLEINRKEVSDVFAVPFSDLLSSEHQGYTSFRNGFRMPVFTGTPQKIWGISAVITDSVLSLLFPENYESKIRMIKKKKKLCRP